MPAELSPDQRAFAESNEPMLVIACPGAGKTRAIISRFLRRTQELERKGIALLSFTNAAMDEAVRRAHAQGFAVGHPHFVGTFDSFIQKNIVGPVIANRMRLQPRFVESWNVLSYTEVVPDKKIGYLRLNLEAFDFNKAGQATLNRDRVTGIRRNALLAAYDRNSAWCNNTATQKRRQRIEQGYFSCSEARRILLELLEGRRRNWVVNALSARFAEVIVDEAQDCAQEELALLEALHEAGVTVSIVGDPDQAIFEFRNAVPERVLEFGERLGQSIIFRENYRSTPAICAVNGIFRASGDPDISKGKYADLNIPVYVVAYDNLNQILPKVIEVLGQHGIPEDRSIILSHKNKDAAEAAQRSNHDAHSDSLVLLAAQASLTLTDNSISPAVRNRHMQKFQAKMFEIHPDIHTHYPEEVAAELGIGLGDLRAKMVRILRSVNGQDMERIEFAATLRTAMDTNDWQFNSASVRACDEERWNELFSGVSDPIISLGTIHSVKGQEFKCACIVIPRVNTKGECGLSAWLKNHTNEARRVLYVGVSRAEQLLCLAIHTRDVDRVKARLRASMLEGIQFI